jgi:predicted glycogen debranching enzyme
MIYFGPDVCCNLEDGLAREWLETNGIGGFASSTVPGINTRRYHGLLTASLRPPVDRYVLLSKVEEAVFLNGAKYDLSANLYAGAVHPNGYTHLKTFRLDPFPIFTYEVGGVQIEKRVFMAHGENTTVIEYEILGAAACTLEVRPLIAFRDYHSTTHANDGLNQDFMEAEGEVSVQPYQSLPRLYFGHNARWTGREGAWYYNFDYPRERERGLGASEDLFQPFVLQFDLHEGAPAVVIASTEPHHVSAAAEIREREIGRRGALRAMAPSEDALVKDLTAAADQFIVTRHLQFPARDLHTVIAGYPWFADWGRDTMIALPGLTLATKRFDIARDILVAFSQVIDRGMCPNRFPDFGEAPEYNTVDASFWYFEAIRKYLEYSGDLAFVRTHLYDTLKSMIDWHLMGTRYGIHCGPDGLISAGGPDTQLTWMDAKIGDFVATPRDGKPVEIQALWYNALRFTESLAQIFDDAEEEKLLAGIAALAAENFNAKFWNEESECLYDVIDGTETPDASIRPNQLIALSLGYTMVDADRARSILGVVERELLTGAGLRTLSPHDPHYIGRYGGGRVERDSAYHQGTVWPWLMGPFITAYVKFHSAEPGGARDARERAAGWLEGFRDRLTDAGLGSISEIFDGDAPHDARGCFAQAWSVAEILRALTEDVYDIHPAPRQTAVLSA